MDSQFPRSVKEDIERSLDTALHEVRLLPSGMHGRTYEIGDGFHRWVARLGMPRKAILAQQAASDAGMRVPKVVDSGIQHLDQKTAYWIVEEFVTGSEFYPERFSREDAVAISTDLGGQLRMLHAVHVDGYGYFTRDALRGRHTTWIEWVAAEEKNIDQAVELAGIHPQGESELREVFRFLQDSYDGSARLCHGDFAGDNVLVDEVGLVAAIDWENAIACDPAHDVAYWFLWHGNAEYLEALLAGYAPHDLRSFRKRVMAHRLLLAAQFVVWYSSQGDQEGVEYSKDVLRHNIGQPADAPDAGRRR